MTRLLWAAFAGGAIALVGALAPPAAGSGPASGWLKGNLHGHAKTDLVGDDGHITHAALHRLYHRHGYDFSVHSPHTDCLHGRLSAWATQLARESRVVGGTTRCTLGQELTVAPGPRWRGARRFLFWTIPKNNDHLGAFGHTVAVRHQESIPVACDEVHATGGVVVVNHPGPGPGQWEPGYWDRPGNRGKVDAIEVYNGKLLEKVGYFGFGTAEGTYLRAVSPTGYGLRVAVTGSTDSHAGQVHRDTHTCILAASSDPRDVAAAVRRRRTVAVTGPRFRDLRIVRVDHLGEVIHSRRVVLGIELSKPARKLTLWRNGRRLRTWSGARQATFRGFTDTPASYVWRATGDWLGKSRFITSAIWYEP